MHFTCKFRYFIPVILLFLIGFKTNLSYQSLQTVFLNHDPARDLMAAKNIVLFNQLPYSPPYCGGCDLLPFLKNSHIYHIFLSFFYTIKQFDGVLVFCSFWISLLIPMAFLISYELTRHYPASVLAALLVTFSPLMQDIAPKMPYQPLFIPTFSALIIWLLLLNTRIKKLYLIILAGLIFLLAVQFHLSALVLGPFYIWNIARNYSKFPFHHRAGIAVFQLIIVFLICLLNIRPPLTYSGGTSLELMDLPQNSFNHLSSDLNTIFPVPVSGLVFILITVFLFLKNFGLRRLWPILILFPLVGVFSYYNYYTTPFWPIYFIIVACTFTLFAGQKLMNFIPVYILILIFSGSHLSMLLIPFQSPTQINYPFFSRIHNTINPLLSPVQPNLVYQYDGYLNTFIGYYLTSNHSYSQLRIIEYQNDFEFDSTLNNKKINKIIFCQNLCHQMEQELVDFHPRLLPTDNFRIYQIE